MKRILVIFQIVMLLTISVFGQEVLEEQTELFGMDSLEDGLPDGAAEEMESYSPYEQANFGRGAVRIFSDAVSQSGGAIRSALRGMVRILAILMLCQMVEQIQPSEQMLALRIAGTLAITACCISDFSSMIGLGRQTMEEIADFSRLLLPVMASAAAGSGAIISSSALYAGAIVFSDGLIQISRSLLLPLIYMFLALAAADGALGEGRLRKMTELVGWSIRMVLKGIMYVFTGFLTITGVLTGNADAAAIKAAKLTISGMVPVIGGIISDASETVLASAGVLRSAAGTYGMLATLAIFLFPFVRLGTSYLGMKATAAFGGMIDQRFTGLLEAISTAMGFLLAMVGSSALMSMISCCCFIKVVQL